MCEGGVGRKRCGDDARRARTGTGCGCLACLCVGDVCVGFAEGAIQMSSSRAGGTLWGEGKARPESQEGSLLLLLAWDDGAPLGRVLSLPQPRGSTHQAESSHSTLLLDVHGARALCPWPSVVVLWVKRDGRT